MTKENGPTPVPHPVDDHDSARQIVWAVVLLAGFVALFYWTSAPPPEDLAGVSQVVAPEDKPDEPVEPDEEPDPPLPSRSETAFGGAEVHVEVQTPTDPQSGWLRIAGVGPAEKKSSATGRYRRNNEFDIDTTNVDRFDVRLADLDVGRMRRLIFHIDGQDMLVFVDEIETISFVRSPEGLWGRP